jgi:LPXTG-motif cell wall-anchored protein
MQLPSGPTSEGSQILATLAVVTQVYVYVPYPGKYANAKMYVYGANVGGDVKFVIPVISAGEFDLTSVRANVDIYNKLGEKVDSFNTESISVPSGARRELAHKWKADVPIGDYLAKASLIYDDGTLNFEEAFSVGSEELELQEISVRGFTLGEIAKLEMLVENKWSEPISDAHVATKIMNDRGDIVSSFESATYDVDPLSKKVFVSYWDTAGVRVGTYETEVSINYGDKSSKKSLQFDVEENELIIIGLGYVISEDGGESNTLMFVLIGVIVLLVLVNILWFFLFRKKFKR